MELAKRKRSKRRRRRRSKPEGKKRRQRGKRRRARASERSFPLPSFPPITDMARFGSCLRTHVFTLSRGDENAEARSDSSTSSSSSSPLLRGRQQHQCPSDSPAALPVLPINFKSALCSFLPSFLPQPFAIRSLELAPCCAPERLSASCCRSSSSSSSSSPKSYIRSTPSICQVRSGVAACSGAIRPYHHCP